MTSIAKAVAVALLVGLAGCKSTPRHTSEAYPVTEMVDPVTEQAPTPELAP